MALEKYDMSLEFSKRAAAYRSEYLPDIYQLMGECFQQLDDPYTIRYICRIWMKRLSSIFFRELRMRTSETGWKNMPMKENSLSSFSKQPLAVSRKRATASAISRFQ
jgi:hypothetical protein